MRVYLPQSLPASAVTTDGGTNATLSPQMAVLQAAVQTSQTWAIPIAFTPADPARGFETIAERFSTGHVYPGVIPDTENYVDDVERFGTEVVRLKNALPRSRTGWEALSAADYENLLALVKQTYRDAVTVFDQYACIATDDFTSTAAGEELLSRLIWTALEKGDPMPYSVSLTLPLTAWNKRVGHDVTTLLKSAAMDVLRRELPLPRENFCFKRGTHVGAEIPADKFDAAALENLLLDFPDLLREQLRALAGSAQFDSGGKIRSEDGKVYVLDVDGTWIDFAELSSKFTLGIEQATSPVLSQPLNHETSRGQIAVAARLARNRAISRAERLLENYGAVALHVDSGTFPVESRHFEFAQGEFPDLDKIRDALILWEEKRPALICDVLAEIGFESIETFESVLNELRAESGRKARGEAPAPAVRDLCLRVQDALGKPVEVGLHLFALKSGWLPRPLHDIHGFARENGPLAEFAALIRDWENLGRTGGADEQERIGERLRGLLPELERLGVKAERALREPNDSDAIKKKYFPTMVARMMRRNAQSRRFHMLAFDIDHLRDFFAANPLFADQFADANMIRILKIAQTALQKYAASLGVDRVDFCRARDGGDELLFVFPETALDRAGQPISLLLSDERGGEGFDDFLRRELAVEFGQTVFPYTDKLQHDNVFERLPEYQLEFAGGAVFKALRSEKPGPDGPVATYHARFLAPNAPVWMDLKALRDDDPVSADRITGPIGFTVAATLFEFEDNVTVRNVRQILDEVFKPLLNKTDAMKARGARGRTAFFRFGALVSSWSMLRPYPPLNLDEAASDLSWIIFADVERESLELLVDPDSIV